MKFLCPSCKAKYQIADEKVIGRTVKMKCRQCGHLIEINEAVTGDARLPGVGRGASPELASDPNATGADRHDGRGKPPPKPVRPTVGQPAPDPRSPTVPIHAHRPAADKAPEKPGIDAKEVKLAAPEKPRSSSLPAPRPAPLRVRHDEASPSAPAAPRGPLAAESQSRPHDQVATRVALEVAATPQTPAIGRLPGVSEAVASSLSATTNKSNSIHHDALAGAFTRAVASAAASEPADHPLAGDEWYVGVNDQPIGPIRLAEIRDRAARGEITAECLVWRDGFEDWKPLTAFPELVAVVEDGIGSLRSLRPPGVVRGAVVTPAPVAIATPIATSLEPALVGHAGLGNTEADVFDVPGIAKPKIPIAAWFAVAMALVLGVTIGLVLMKPEPPKEIVKYVEVPVSAKPGIGDVAPPPAPPGEGKSGTEGANSEGAAAADKRASGSSVRKPNGSANLESPNPVSSADAPPQGLKGLQGLQGLGAPRTGPASEVAASAAGRQQLDSATLSRTVSRYTASVKRSCWQPALDTRAPDASTSARISANIVVAASGKVQSVSVSPDPKGYRGLSSCIQARVRNWEFPPAGGSTEFNVPFVFAAQ